MSEHNVISLIGKILQNELEMNLPLMNLDVTLLEIGIDSITFMTLIVYIEEELNTELDLIEDFESEYSKITLHTLVSSILKSYGE